MDSTKTYTARYWRDPESPGYWLGELTSEPGVHTYGRTLREVQSRLREAFEAWLEVEDLTGAGVEVVNEVEVGGLGDDLRSLDIDRTALEQYSDQVVARTRQLAHQLARDNGLSLRDTATALGVSHQRVAQLLEQEPPSPDEIVVHQVTIENGVVAVTWGVRNSVPSRRVFRRGLASGSDAEVGDGWDVASSMGSPIGAQTEAIQGAGELTPKSDGGAVAIGSTLTTSPSPGEVDSHRRNPMSDNNRHVVPNSDGGWDVVKPGSSRASAHTDRQADAIDRAREIVHNAGGGEVVTHGRDGKIRDKDTVAPGNDPFPPRG